VQALRLGQHRVGTVEAVLDQDVVPAVAGVDQTHAKPGGRGLVGEHRHPSRVPLHDFVEPRMVLAQRIGVQLDEVAIRMPGLHCSMVRVLPAPG
jgi:hypothetical protein